MTACDWSDRDSRGRIVYAPRRCTVCALSMRWAAPDVRECVSYDAPVVARQFLTAIGIASSPASTAPSNLHAWCWDGSANAPWRPSRVQPRDQA